MEKRKSEVIMIMNDHHHHHSHRSWPVKDSVDQVSVKVIYHRTHTSKA